MSTKLKAGTATSGAVIDADTTGILELQSGSTPTTAVTIDASQNVAFSKGFTVGVTAAPAFSAYANADLSIPNSSATKVLFQTEEWDTNNNFASSRFTPTVAGYYQFNAQISWSAANNSRNVIYLYRNGNIYKVGNDFSGNNNVSNCVSCIGYANGTTDYFEIYCIQLSGGSLTLANAAYNTWFTGAMIRSA